MFWKHFNFDYYPLALYVIIFMRSIKNIRVLVAPDKFRPKMTAARVC